MGREITIPPCFKVFTFTVEGNVYFPFLLSPTIELFSWMRFTLLQKTIEELKIEGHFFLYNLLLYGCASRKKKWLYIA